MKISHKVSLLIILFSLIFPYQSEAQLIAPFDSSKATISKEYIYSYGYDIRDICVSPLCWEKKDWLIFSGVALGTVALFSVDEQVQKWSQEKRNALSDKISSNLFEPWGTGKLYKNYSVLTLTSAYLTGIITKNERTKMVAMEATRAWAISSLFIAATKVSFGRYRPNQGKEPDSWHWVGPNTKSYYSFVAGHTMATWATATVFANRYRHKPIIPIISYTIASFAGLSRIHDNKHWISDVFAGAAFGWAIGKLIVIRNNWGVQLSQSANGIGLSYSF